MKFSKKIQFMAICLGITCGVCRATEDDGSRGQLSEADRISVMGILPEGSNYQEAGNETRFIVPKFLDGGNISGGATLILNTFNGWGIHSHLNYNIPGSDWIIRTSCCLNSAWMLNCSMSIDKEPHVDGTNVYLWKSKKGLEDYTLCQTVAVGTINLLQKILDGQTGYGEKIEKLRTGDMTTALNIVENDAIRATSDSLVCSVE